MELWRLVVKITIKSLLVNNLGKGITVYKGERGYLPGEFDVKTACDIITTIVTRLELLSINASIAQVDPSAFTYTHKIKETNGAGIVKKKVKTQLKNEFSLRLQLKLWHQLAWKGFPVCSTRILLQVRL